MKKQLLIIAAMAATGAMAHGPIAEQAVNAIDTATGIFLKKNPKDVTKQFLSVSATKTGHEQFAVEITLQDKTTKYTYQCVENETVEPVVWECQ